MTALLSRVGDVADRPYCVRFQGIVASVRRKLGVSSWRVCDGHRMRKGLRLGIGWRPANRQRRWLDAWGGRGRRSGPVCWATHNEQLAGRGRSITTPPISAYLAGELIEGIHVIDGTGHSGRITVAQLLDQTSGLADHFKGKP